MPSRASRLPSPDYAEFDAQATQSDGGKVWPALEILAETKSKYLVRWEGVDDSGQPWPDSWEPRRNCNSELLREWQEKKKAKRQRRPSSKSSASRSSRLSSVVSGRESPRKRARPGEGASVASDDKRQSKRPRKDSPVGDDGEHEADRGHERVEVVVVIPIKPRTMQNLPVKAAVQVNGDDFGDESDEDPLKVKAKARPKSRKPKAPPNSRFSPSKTMSSRPAPVASTSKTTLAMSTRLEEQQEEEHELDSEDAATPVARRKSSSLPVEVSPSVTKRVARKTERHASSSSIGSGDDRAIIDLTTRKRGQKFANGTLSPGVSRSSKSTSSTIKKRGSTSKSTIDERKVRSEDEDGADETDNGDGTPAAPYMDTTPTPPQSPSHDIYASPPKPPKARSKAKDKGKQRALASEAQSDGDQRRRPRTRSSSVVQEKATTKKLKRPLPPLAQEEEENTQEANGHVPTHIPASFNDTDYDADIRPNKEHPSSEPNSHDSRHSRTKTPPPSAQTADTIRSSGSRSQKMKGREASFGSPRRAWGTNIEGSPATSPSRAWADENVLLVNGKKHMRISRIPPPDFGPFLKHTNQIPEPSPIQDFSSPEKTNRGPFVPLDEEDEGPSTIQSGHFSAENADTQIQGGDHHAFSQVAHVNDAAIRARGQQLAEARPRADKKQIAAQRKSLGELLQQRRLTPPAVPKDAAPAGLMPDGLTEARIEELLNRAQELRLEGFTPQTSSELDNIISLLRAAPRAQQAQLQALDSQPLSPPNGHADANFGEFVNGMSETDNFGHLDEEEVARLEGQYLELSGDVPEEAGGEVGVGQQELDESFLDSEAISPEDTMDGLAGNITDTADADQADNNAAVEDPAGGQSSQTSSESQVFRQSNWKTLALTSHLSQNARANLSTQVMPPTACLDLDSTLNSQADYLELQVQLARAMERINLLESEQAAQTASLDAERAHHAAAVEAESTARAALLAGELADHAAVIAQHAEATASWTKERAALAEKQEAAERQVIEFQTQYRNASAFADELRQENQTLRTQAQIAQSQATSGVALVRATFEGRVKKLEEELQKWKRTAEMEQQMHRRTDDDIRKKAAEHPELMRKLQAAEEERDALEQECADLEKEKEQFQNQALSMAERSVRQEQAVKQANEAVDKTCGEMVRLSKALRAVHNATDERVEGDENGFPCRFRLDGMAPCGQTFPTKEELTLHVASHLATLETRSLMLD